MLICLSDVATACPDKKSILMYVTSLFQVLPQQVTMEAIREVEMLPRHSRVTREEHTQVHQQHFSQEVNCHCSFLLSCCFFNFPYLPQKFDVSCQWKVKKSLSVLLYCFSHCTRLFKLTSEELYALQFPSTALDILAVKVC